MTTPMGQLPRAGRLIIEARRGGEWVTVPSSVARGPYAETPVGREKATERVLTLAALVGDADFRLVSGTTGSVLFQQVKRGARQ